MDINLKIEKGDFVFITGPSGAGKTTLLRLIYGDDRPDRGQILVHGINLLTIRKSKIPYLRRHLGIIFQDFKLLNKRTVYENVAFSLKVTGTPPNELKKKTWNALKTVGLTKKQDFIPSRLSGGEQQRVAIARAMINDPLILLADEPTGNLDPEITRDIMILFRSINLRGTTVVIATHNKELLRNTDQRIIYLHNGTIHE